MKRGKIYLGLAFGNSISLGVILPFALGVKDLSLIAITFSSVWFIYAVVLFVITFLVTGRKSLKKQLKDGFNEKWGYS
jgi:hypothetical protein